MGWIILLIILGILLFLAELLLLPGITIAAVGSFCCLVAASAMAFTYHGLVVGFIVTGVILVIIIVATMIFLRAKTWRRVALNTKITESSAPEIQAQASVGDTGLAISRLAPMGKVIINNRTLEAKTQGQYIDQGTEIEVIGFDNSNIIVKSK